MLPEIPDLDQCLWDLIAQVPRGCVTTCGALADALGSYHASRWIGHRTLHHEHSPDCPCHRVIRAEGALGGYVAGSMDDKIVKLRADGVEVPSQPDARVDLEKFAFTGFRTDYPLHPLAQLQRDWTQRIVISRRRRIPDLVAGVDVSYPSGNIGVAAYALIDTATGQLVWYHTIRREVRFPYVTSFLAFRELPLYDVLLDEVDSLGGVADVIVVDGSGILHPRGSGIACMLGVMTGIPTVGITKKLLCGRPDESNAIEIQRKADGNESRRSARSGMLEVVPIVHNDKQLGTLIRRRGLQRKLYVSPGHRCDVEFAESLALATLHQHSLTEPIYHADRLSREAAKMR